MWCFRETSKLGRKKIFLGKIPISRANSTVHRQFELLGFYCITRVKNLRFYKSFVVVCLPMREVYLYLEYSISQTLDISNKTIGPILINLHKMTTRQVELSMSRTNLLVPL